MTRPKLHAKDVLALLLIVAGLAVLGRALWSDGDGASTTPAAPDMSSAPPASVLGQPMEEAIDVESLFSAHGFHFPLRPEGRPPTREEVAGPRARVLALFLLHAKVCPPCLEELSQYVELLELESPTVPIRSLALVIEEDAERGERFVLTTPLPLTVGHGPPESLGRLVDHLGERQQFQQVVFVDLERGVLFYRTWLRNTLTPLGLKRSVLKEMHSAHRRVAG